MIFSRTLISSFLVPIGIVIPRFSIQQRYGFCYPMQCPSVVRYRKILTFVEPCGLCCMTLHICESVFRKSFVENVEVFLIIRAERNNTHFRIDTCGRSRSAYPYPISIRVWGIVSSIYDQGLSTTFNKINGSQLHTFFVYTHRYSVGAQM